MEPRAMEPHCHSAALPAGSMPRPSGLVLALVLGTAGVALATSSVAAQPAAALGKPLPADDLEAGTVTVRVIAGSTASPVSGTDVTLTINGTPRVARTDSAGRATFAGLPAGATAVAKVIDEDKAEHASEAFPIPSAGGTRIMITTKPFQPGAGGAPFAGGGDGKMPNPRKLSGEARPERGDPAGTVTVRVSYDDLADTPEGIPVTLVGYSWDDSVSYKTILSDKAGRAQFTDLDRSGGTSYFAITVMPRGNVLDRLMSLPIILDSQTGIRMILSSEKRMSSAPAIDDLAKGEEQSPTPAGKFRVVLEGAAEPSMKVRLIDAETKKLIGEAKPTASQPDPSRVQGGAQFVADAALPPGTLDVEVLGGAGDEQNPVPGIEIRVAAAQNQDASAGVAAVTGADGTVRMEILAKGPQRAAFMINGRALGSKPFDLTQSGGKLVVRAQWDGSGRYEAMIDAPLKPGQVVYAETTSQRNQHYRSLPVPVLEATGTKISLYVFPRIMFRFQLQGFSEDQLLAVQGRFDIMNYSWAPYRAGPDGILVPMPRGHKGGVVASQDQSDVSVAAGEGFRIVRPIPPGSKQFHAGFSMPVADGKVAWSLDLPMGSYQSELDIKKTRDMKAEVTAPKNTPNEVRTVPQGTFAVIGPINIMPNQSMQMTIEGLPSEPAWRVWVPRFVGLVVVAMLVGGMVLALSRKPRAEVAANEARRQALLDQLVELERSGGNPKRREQLLTELEQLWG